MTMLPLQVFTGLGNDNKSTVQFKYADGVTDAYDFSTVTRMVLRLTDESGRMVVVDTDVVGQADMLQWDLQASTVVFNIGDAVIASDIYELELVYFDALYPEGYTIWHPKRADYQAEVFN